MCVYIRTSEIIWQTPAGFPPQPQKMPERSKNNWLMKNSAPPLRLKCCNDDVAGTEKEKKTKQKSKIPEKTFLCARLIFYFKRKSKKCFKKKGEKFCGEKYYYNLYDEWCREQVPLSFRDWIHD